MAGRFTIGDLSKAAGVPTSTVRYYERKRLLRPAARSAANYRLYSQEDLERLRFIRAAQATGFTLESVAKLLRPAPCGRVQQLIEERLEQVATRLKELRHLQRLLKASLETCKEHEASGRCQVVEDLTARTRSKRL